MPLQALDARHRRAVGREHDVALLDAGFGRGARGLLDQEATLHVPLALLVAGERAHGEAELAALVRGLAVGSGALIVHGAELDA